MFSSSIACRFFTYAAMTATSRTISTTGSPLTMRLMRSTRRASARLPSGASDVPRESVGDAGAGVAGFSSSAVSSGSSRRLSESNCAFQMRSTSDL